MLRIQDQSKTSMMEFSIDVANRNAVARDLVGLKDAVFSGAKSYEENIVQRTVDKNANAPRWMTPQNSITVIVVKNRADRALFIFTISLRIFVCRC